MSNQLFIDLLPDSAKGFLEFISFDSLKLLIAEYGGSRLTVPKCLDDDHALVHLLGKEEAEQLCKAFKLEVVSIPRCFKAMTAIRDVDILKGKRGGLTLGELARQHGVTEVTVNSALRRAEKIELNYRRKNAKTA